MGGFVQTKYSLANAILPGYYIGDIDIEEMFLNFILHNSMWERCGFDSISFCDAYPNHFICNHPVFHSEQYHDFATTLKDEVDTVDSRVCLTVWDVVACARPRKSLI
jgi:hypothetical protein